MRTKHSNSSSIAEALNSGPNDPAPPTVWAVMQFGLGIRPHIATSTDRELAFADFLQQIRMLAVLFPGSKFRMIGDDQDGALMGLSFYRDGHLAVALQPTGGLVRHPLQPELPSLPAGTFSESAPILLAALERRATLAPNEKEAYAHSSVAMSWKFDVDQELVDMAYSEAEAQRMVLPEIRTAAWNSICSARTLICLFMPLVDGPEEPDSEWNVDPSLPLVEDSLYFQVQGPPTKLPVAFSVETGQATKHRLGAEVVLRCKSGPLQMNLDQIDKLVADAMDAAGATSGPYSDMASVDRMKLAGLLCTILTQFPCYVDGQATLAGMLYAEGRFEDAITVVEPVAQALLEILPEDGYIQVPYWELENRPFHRTMHVYVLALGKVKRHLDANRLAKRMLELWPSDNLGFRNLTTQAKRQGVSDD